MKSLLKTSKKNVCIVVNPPSGAEQRTLVVLGVQRGGTSMAAGVLRALGVDLGKAGLNHEDPRFLSATDEQLGKVIAERNAEADVWGFKAPETTLQLDYLTETLRNPHYVCVMRNIAAVIDSFIERSGGQSKPVGAMRRVLKYYNRIGRLMAETDDPIVLVNYERASASPSEFVQAMIEFAGVEVDDATRARAEAMVSGDGGGYLNLPDEYFHVAEAAGASLPKGVEAGFKVSEMDTDKGRFEIDPVGEFLPNRFRVELGGLSQETPVRFIFRFDESYSWRFNHELPAGEGVFEVETHGTVRGCRIAIPEAERPAARLTAVAEVRQSEPGRPEA